MASPFLGRSLSPIHDTQDRAHTTSLLPPPPTPGVPTQICNMMIKICGREESGAQSALELFKQMESRYGCVPDQLSYKTILRALGEAGQIDEALELFRGMREKGLEPTSVSRRCDKPGRGLRWRTLS